MEQRDRLSTFATASMLAFLAAAVLLAGLRWYLDTYGPSGEGDPRDGAAFILVAGLVGLAGTALALLICVGVLYRYGLRLPVPSLRLPGGVAPLTGRWLTLMLLWGCALGTAWLLGLEAMAVLWAALLVPVAVVAALSNAGDV